MEKNESTRVRIKKATESDIPLILEFIKKLAVYEKMEDEVEATEELLHRYIFGKERLTEVVIAYEIDPGIKEEIPVGFALYFHNFSTFLARPGLYLEDLFVLEEYRGRGYGKALLAHLAGIAVERECGRFEWSVLNWNKPAIDFYKSLGAQPLDGWTVYRLTGDKLKKAAKSSVYTKTED